MLSSQFQKESVCFAKAVPTTLRNLVRNYRRETLPFTISAWYVSSRGVNSFSLK